MGAAAGFSTAAVYVAIASAVATAAASAYAQYQAGQSQANVLKYQATLAANQATAARQAAEVREKQDRERTDRIRATARARAAASGVISTEGSPLMVMLENARQAEYEAQLIRYGGEVQSQFATSEARLRMFQGAEARRTGAIGAGTTLLAGVSNAGGAYYKMYGGGGVGIRAGGEGSP